MGMARNTQTKATTCFSLLSLSKQYVQSTVLETNNSCEVYLITMHFFFELKITVIEILGWEPQEWRANNETSCFLLLVGEPALPSIGIPKQPENDLISIVTVMGNIKSAIHVLTDMLSYKCAQYIR